MIAKQIIKKANIKGSFGGLARYIADAPDKGEKLEYLYSQNLYMSQEDLHDINFELENLNETIIEAEMFQSFNNSPNTTDKNYHLLISFQENEKPTLAQVRDIVNEFSNDLGFKDHHRLVACHANTDNFHIHVAISRVHPETYKMHSPFRDFVTMARTARRMELKHGFKVSKGMTDSLENNKTKIKNISDDIEANTWQQSFYSYCQENKPALQKLINTAKNWQEVHEGFNELGLHIKKFANGLVICDNNSTKGMKASNLGREFSKNALEKRFGQFEPLIKIDKTKEKKRFEEKPLTKHPKTKEYFQKFKERTKKLGVSSKKLKEAGIFSGNNFKLFLEYLMMDGDILAMAIMNFHKQTLGLGVLKNL